MERQQFLDTARRIANSTPTAYQLGGWGQQSNGVYLFDCVCLIKSILWGFDFEQGEHGGAVYASNGVPDYGANRFFDECCYDKSSDFTNLEEGELVWMDGHIGIVDKNRKCIEATSAWESKVLISEIGMNGERIHNGRQVYDWEFHGKCDFIDYIKPTPTPEPQTFKYNVGEEMILNGHLYATSNGDGQGKMMNDCKCTIMLRHEGIKPYNVDTTGSGNYDGWVAECNLRPYEEPTNEIVLGTRVRTTGTGNGSSYGDGGDAMTGLEGTITNIIEGRPYPYLVSDNEGPLGWYKKENLEII